MAKSAQKINWKSKTKDPEGQHVLKRLAVLKIAATLFLEKGFHNTSMDHIARELGVTKPVIYYYLKNKDEILIGCTDIAQERLLKLMDETQALDVSALDKLEIFFRQYAEYTLDEFGRCMIALSDRPLFKSEHHIEIIREKKRAIQQSVENLIKAGIKDKSITPCDVHTTAVMLFYTFNGLPNWWHPKSKTNKLDKVFNNLWQTISGGISAA